MSWLSKIISPGIRSEGAEKKGVAEGVWVKCPKCSAAHFAEDMEANFQVCNKCGHHLRLGARARVNSLLDEKPRREIANDIVAVDTLKFKDSKKYSDRLKAAQTATGENEALVVVQGCIRRVPVVLAVFEFEFMGGSMGSVVGEKFARGVAAAVKHKLPFISVAASGGARMQEGLQSLMQMAKTTAALGDLSKNRLPYISILTDPTMGGVSASFAFMGDVVIAEPHALIGFAGPRVIEQTVREVLPEGFQRAEFLLEKGAIDMIVPRGEMAERIVHIISLLQNRPASATAAAESGAK
jgi:acetyl-CoA carboxylase carboxyl transferase subunit beta